MKMFAYENQSDLDVHNVPKNHDPKMKIRHMVF